jgi:hypothetical protein
MAKPSNVNTVSGGGGARAAIKKEVKAASKKTVTASPTQKARLAAIARNKSSNYVARNSVKVLPPLSDVARANLNVIRDIKAKSAKSGAAAKVGAAKIVNRNWYMSPLGSKPKVIKINSGGMSGGGGLINRNTR